METKTNYLTKILPDFLKTMIFILLTVFLLIAKFANPFRGTLQTKKKYVSRLIIKEKSETKVFSNFPSFPSSAVVS